jgi:hypothetical protein
MSAIIDSGSGVSGILPTVIYAAPWTPALIPIPPPFGPRLAVAGISDRMRWPSRRPADGKFSIQGLLVVDENKQLVAP